MINTILISAVISGMIIATATDLKKREVPDWLNYSLIFFGLGARLIYSVYYLDFFFFLEGVLGLAVLAMIGLLMFYTGQWGGGDTKLLMGVGALMGLSFDFSEFPLIVSFFINLLIVGAGYGLLWSVVLSIKHRKKFKVSFRKNHKKVKTAKRFIIITSVLIFIPVFIFQSLLLKISFIVLAVIPVSTLYVWLFAKSVEQSCMFKKVKPDELTEGDWVEDDIKIGRKKIYSKKELGVSKKHIALLKKYYSRGKIRKITVKEGIPFVPSFLIAYAVTLFFGSWFLMFL